MHDFSKLRGFWTEKSPAGVVMGDDTGAPLLVVQSASDTGILNAATLDDAAARALVNQLAARWQACVEALEQMERGQRTLAKVTLRKAIAGL